MTPAVPRKRKAVVPKQRESVIVRAILEALKWRTDVIAWRNNTGAFKGTYKGRERFVRFGLPGQGDISGLIKPWGVHLEIECKRVGGEQSDLQAKHEARIREAGGVYILATSHGECIAALDAEIRVLAEKYGEKKEVANYVDEK